MKPSLIHFFIIFYFFFLQVKVSSQILKNKIQEYCENECEPENFSNLEFEKCVKNCKRKNPNRNSTTKNVVVSDDPLPCLFHLEEQDFIQNSNSQNASSSNSHTDSSKVSSSKNDQRNFEKKPLNPNKYKKGIHIHPKRHVERRSHYLNSRRYYNQHNSNFNQHVKLNSRAANDYYNMKNTKLNTNGDAKCQKDCLSGEIDVEECLAQECNLNCNPSCFKNCNPENGNLNICIDLCCK